MADAIKERDNKDQESGRPVQLDPEEQQHEQGGQEPGGKPQPGQGGMKPPARSGKQTQR
jgi:hypothetical protein